VKVLDFGLAKLTEGNDSPADTEAVTRALVQTDAAVVLGTARYLSPEQARGKPLDTRTDIWSFGVVLYEMATGRPPFTGETRTDVIVSIARSEPLPILRFAPEVPAEFEWIVMKALRKKVEERYQNIKELETDLKKLKQRIDFHSELARSMGPEKLTGPTSAMMPTEITATQPAQTTSTEVGGTEATPAALDTRASAAESLFGKIKQHRLALSLVAVTLVLIMLGVMLWNWQRQTTLTDRDTILLADFNNVTGDAVFDGTLRQALAVQLGQSPFLDIFSEERVREALRFMGRPPDERVTREIGREICQRHGLKALLVSSIASLGNRYLITLEAVNARTGDVIATEQIQAENKDQVLPVLGEAAVKLREQLGESLQSIQEFDAPIEQGTTPSLEALKAFSLGVEQQLNGRYLEAVPFLKRATELDPNFALAYARMSSMYHNTRQFELSAAASQKAFDLRERVSERERFYISGAYYDNVTGELDKYLETLELWKRTYPRDASPQNNLAVKYNELGQFEKALEAARAAGRLNPNSASGYSLIAAALLGLDRYAEAREIILQAQSQKLDTTSMRRILYRIAFIQGDTGSMKQQIDWMTGKPDEYAAQGWQSEAAAFAGQLRQAREFSQRAFEFAERRDLKDVAAQIAVGGATRDALFGDCAQVKAETAKALALTNNPITTINAANALATCKEFAQAQSIIGDLPRRFPTDTLLNKALLPLVQARIEFQKGNAAQAIQLLESTRPYEGYALFQIAYLRGQAFLNLQKGAEAAVEFQKIIDHRGSQATSPIYALAHLGLTRAYLLSGDHARAGKTYRSFLALWKDADRDLPVMRDLHLPVE
jgi:tetratricopeptide (TPR) repeat protein